MIQSYKQAADSSYQSNIESLPKRPRGAKTMLPEELDEKVIAMIKNMRSAGSVISYDITIAIARGIVLANDRTLLKENGGYIDLTAIWAHSIHQALYGENIQQPRHLFR